MLSVDGSEGRSFAVKRRWGRLSRLHGSLRQQLLKSLLLPGHHTIKRVFMWKPVPRSAQTTIACNTCQQPLIARRTCYQAFLHCEKCRKDYPLQDYVKKMDSALEAFLEAINCDRV